MFPIPPEGSEARERMVAEHRACIDSMKGVAGCSILRTERPGSAIEPHGGIHEHVDLAKVLVRMRAMPPGAYDGKYVVICTEVDKQWRIGRLTGVRGQPPRFVNDKLYTDENEIQHDIFCCGWTSTPRPTGCRRTSTRAGSATTTTGRSASAPTSVPDG